MVKSLSSTVAVPAAWKYKSKPVTLLRLGVNDWP